jgi:sulfate-transporting ATPase
MRCGCPPGDADVASLSGGEKPPRRAVPSAVERPDLLLLDEPTNHLDAESVAWIERFLADYEGTVVAITHDRYFLDNVASWILELDHGKGMPFEGNYSGWLEQKQARMAKEEKHASTRQRTLERELEWVRMAPKARQAKSKARLAAYDQLLAEQQAARGSDVGWRSTSRRAIGWATSGDRGGPPEQGLRRQAADRRPLVLPAARRASSA